ncbi:MAG: hypothetical protein ACOWWR_03155 [Eubacteriales bacterium]
MRRVLILDDTDFDGNVKSLSTLKKSVKELEPMFDDIFYADDGTITCFKARANRVGEYTLDQMKEYLFEDQRNENKESI